MHKIPMLAMLVLAAVVAAPGASAQSTMATPDMKAAAMQLTVTGVVTAVYPADRAVVVQGPEGRTSLFTVGPEVRNFDQIRPGDKVDVDYEVAVAVALVKGKIGREKIESETAARAPLGAKPGAAMVRTTTIVARIVNVDTARSLATLQGPEGRYAVVNVRDPAVLADLKVGDDVIVGFHEAAAIAIRRAK